MQDPVNWNELDTMLAGNLPVPPALPYPVDREGVVADQCQGWKLRSALKQHLFILVPFDAAGRSHSELFQSTLEALGGSIGVGVDPFEVVERKGGARQEQWCPARQKLLDNLKAFKGRFEDLCFGSGGGGPHGALGVNIDFAGQTFEVKRGAHTVFVKDMNVPSAFPKSRDWFEMFFDDNYSPPKLFHLVVQWIVCSSNHMVNFVSRLTRLAEDSGFALVRLPIAQLFPPPAPSCVWGEDQETNFDRLTFYPRRKIRLPGPPE